MSASESYQVDLPPVVKNLTVALPVEAAFQLFTEGVARWWPLKSHSVFGDDAVSCVLEPHVGGRFYEVHRDGRESQWGRVLTWEPPHRVILAFHPGRALEMAGEVEVTFEPAPQGKTHVTLAHGGWERLGPNAEAMRGNYISGWDVVLGSYVEVAAKG